MFVQQSNTQMLYVVQKKFIWLMIVWKTEHFIVLHLFVSMALYQTKVFVATGSVIYLDVTVIEAVYVVQMDLIKMLQKHFLKENTMWHQDLHPKCTLYKFDWNKCELCLDKLNNFIVWHKLKVCVSFRRQVQDWFRIHKKRTAKNRKHVDVFEFRKSRAVI